LLTQKNRTQDGASPMEKVDLLERINKLLFYKNKQYEKKISQLENTIHGNKNPMELTPTDQIPDINENEKVLLAQIEQQNIKINELQDKLNSQYQVGVDPTEHIEFLQKRTAELASDSKRYFEKYKTARSDYIKLLASLTNEKIYGAKRAREVLANLNAYQKIGREEDIEERKIYEKRVEEIEKNVREYLEKHNSAEKRIKELEEKLKEKQNQETKIENYVNKLLGNYKETKEDIVNLLKMCKEGKSIPNEFYTKYLQG